MSNTIRRIKVGTDQYDIEPANTAVLGSDHITGALGYTPLSPDDIANNLTTTASGKVLDARQGKALNDIVQNKAGKCGFNVSNTFTFDDHIFPDLSESDVYYFCNYHNNYETYCAVAISSGNYSISGTIITANCDESSDAIFQISILFYDNYLVTYTANATLGTVSHTVQKLQSPVESIQTGAHGGGPQVVFQQTLVGDIDNDTYNGKITFTGMQAIYNYIVNTLSFESISVFSGTTANPDNHKLFYIHYNGPNSLVIQDDYTSRHVEVDITQLQNDTYTFDWKALANLDSAWTTIMTIVATEYFWRAGGLEAVSGCAMFLGSTPGVIYIEGINNLPLWDNTKVSGAASSTDNAIARFDGTTGKIIKNSGVTIDDNRVISGNGSTTLTSSGNGNTTLTSSAQTIVSSTYGTFIYGNSGAGAVIQDAPSATAAGLAKINLSGGSVGITASRGVSISAPSPGYISMSSSGSTTLNQGYLFISSSASAAEISGGAKIAGRSDSSALTVQNNIDATNPALSINYKADNSPALNLNNSRYGNAINIGIVNNSSITGTTNKWNFPTAAGDNNTYTFASREWTDTNKVSKSGDTMTGSLTMFDADLYFSGSDHPGLCFEGSSDNRIWYNPSAGRFELTTNDSTPIYLGSSGIELDSQRLYLARNSSGFDYNSVYLHSVREDNRVFSTWLTSGDGSYTQSLMFGYTGSGSESYQYSINWNWYHDWYLYDNDYSRNIISISNNRLRGYNGESQSTSYLTSSGKINSSTYSYSQFCTVYGRPSSTTNYIRVYESTSSSSTTGGTLVAVAQGGYYSTSAVGDCQVTFRMRPGYYYYVSFSGLKYYSSTSASNTGVSIRHWADI